MNNIDIDFLQELVNEDVDQDVLDRLTPEELEVYINLKREQNDD